MFGQGPVLSTSRPQGSEDGEVAEVESWPEQENGIMFEQYKQT